MGLSSCDTGYPFSAASRRQGRECARRLLGHALSSDLRGLSEVPVRMTQADLALMLGAGRSRTNAALKTLERRGLIRVGYRGITIIDLPGLRVLAGPETYAY
jgi:CRP-like cAMP-binding protein